MLGISVLLLPFCTFKPRENDVKFIEALKLLNNQIDVRLKCWHRSAEKRKLIPSMHQTDVKEEGRKSTMGQNWWTCREQINIL